MRNFNYTQYIDVIENSKNPILQKYMKDEAAFLKKHLKRDDFVFDLGAGYGRILNILAQKVAAVFAVEINQQMYVELKNRSSLYTNVTPILEDINKLQKIYDGIQKPSEGKCGFLLLQNTLGVIEDGTYQEVIQSIKRTSCALDEPYLILSVFNGNALSTFGMTIYSEIADIVGKIDINKTDFKKAIIKTLTGYEAKWWHSEEINSIVDQLNGRITHKIVSEEYSILKITIDYHGN